MTNWSAIWNEACTAELQRKRHLRGLMQRNQKQSHGIIRKVINVALALAGTALFVHLLRASGVSSSMLLSIGPLPIALLFLFSGAVIFLDTVAWSTATSHVKRPALWPLFGLRISGDALTNGLPGGMVLGETYKVMMMRRLFGLSLADSTSSLLVVRLALGATQAVFVLLGLALASPQLAARSTELFGFPGAHFIAVGLTLGMGVLLAIPIFWMARGRSFRTLANWLERLPGRRLKRWIKAKEPEIAVLDGACQKVFHNNHKNLLVMIFYLQLGWLVSVGETYVLLYYLGLKPTLATALVIESVGSLFRLVFFMVPSGIGGQDASFLALFKLYGLPLPAAGIYVLFKRFKEIAWIGLGFLLAFLHRRPAVEEPSGWTHHQPSMRS